MTDSIQFKALNEGIGFHQEEEPETDPFASVDLFHNLDSADPQLYEKLMERLEDPILESFNEMFEEPSKKALPQEKKQAPVLKKQESKVWEKASPLGKNMLLPSSALKLDLAFSLGLYLMACVSFGLLFSTKALPSIFLMIFGFGLLHQIYLAVCRSLIGSSLGEERCNIGWNGGSPIHFLLRGILLSLTGFVFIPFVSALIGRDVLEDLTGLYPQYNI